MKQLITAIMAVFSVLASSASSAAKMDDDMLEKATFAGGCFWCLVKPFKVDGVHSVISGYAGGHVENPSYKQVTTGATGHREVVQIVFDPKSVSFEMLLNIFWENIDPFNESGQFCDNGFQYTAAIYTHTEDQKTVAGKSLKAQQQRFSERIVTSIEPFVSFYPAEEYHQDYYLKNPIRYKYYRTACGRDRRLKQIKVLERF